MTITHPTEAGKGAAAHRRYAVAHSTKMKAEAYQRQGMTLTEISERMGYSREVMVDVLYVEAVRK